MANIFLFLRHGDYHQLENTPSAHQPFPLTSQGIEQAKKGAESIREILNKKGWKLHPTLHSSTSLRAWQTADVLLKEIGGCHEIKSSPELCERSLGSVGNLSVKTIEQVLRDDPRYTQAPKDWKSNSHYCLPFEGAESLMAAGQRVKDYILQTLQPFSIRKAEKETTTDSPLVHLFVGHGASFRHCAYHLGLLNFDQITQYSMYHATPLAFQQKPNTSWQHIEGEWKIRKSKDLLLD